MTLSEIAREQKFNAAMRAGRSKSIVEWEKLAYGVLAVAMIAKGIYHIEKL